MHYITGAFPSACGKTNLAMLVPPASMPGWKAWTVGDDIAWLRPGDGRPAVGGQPGSRASSASCRARAARRIPNAFDMIQRNTIYTNVALRPDGTPWWEGHDDPAPAEALDWQGRPWTPASTEKAAHPNSRFTDAGGAVRVDLAGVRESRTACRSTRCSSARAASAACRSSIEARDWQHGTFLGATLSSETTAAATGKVGVLRRDPMAMLPFCGYNMGDYFAHWLDVGAKLTNAAEDLPRELVPHRRGRTLPLARLRRQPARAEVGPRALRRTRQGASRPPIGAVPTLDAIDRTGLDLSDDVMADAAEGRSGRMGRGRRRAGRAASDVRRPHAAGDARRARATSRTASTTPSPRPISSAGRVESSSLRLAVAFGGSSLRFGSRPVNRQPNGKRTATELLTANCHCGVSRTIRMGGPQR